MLTEKRQEEIVRLVQERESITVAELKDILQTSESTIRRDITSLDKEGRLTKVFGGAIALRTAQIVNQELSVVQKQELQTTEKQAIAQYAASLIEPDDCVYLDAGIYQRTQSYLYYKCFFPREAPLRERLPCHSDRRRIKRLNRSYCWSRGSTEHTEISF